MDDLISRKAVMVALKASCVELGGSEWGDGEMGVHKDDIEAIVNSIPSANQWILVSDRVPEEGTEVLGTDRNGCIRHVFKDKSPLYEFATVEEAMHINIFAWMPLPKPWKGEEE